LTKTVDKNGKEEARQYTEFDLADKLRQRGWVLPAYTMVLLHSMHLVDLVVAGLTWLTSCAGVPGWSCRLVLWCHARVLYLPLA